VRGKKKKNPTYQKTSDQKSRFQLRLMSSEKKAKVSGGSAEGSKVGFFEGKKKRAVSVNGDMGEIEGEGKQNKALDVLVGGGSHSGFSYGWARAKKFILF